MRAIMAAVTTVRDRVAAEAPAGARGFRAPGRVNLMGDHTDYYEGLVLPLAIELECVVASSRNEDGRVRVRSLDEEPAVEVGGDGADEGAPPGWGRYVAGVVRALAERGREPAGIDAVLASSVPPGSGLSSSAALEVALALALCDAAGLDLDATELALACQRAEHLATGVPSGIMDQLAATSGAEGHALLIDCRSLEHERVPMPEGLEVLVVHSGKDRELEDTPYAERRAAGEAIASALGLDSLRDATLEQVADEPIARHVVTENERVRRTAAALATGDRAALAELFTASHRSLRDDYRVSTPELDLLVAALIEAGAVGARLTGAGFGGAVVALCEAGAAEAVAHAAAERYAAETGIEPASWVTRAAAAAGPLPRRR
jgi:galactokinase